jgi:RNA polymerase sigma-70 factor (family 1)
MNETTFDNQTLHNFQLGNENAFRKIFDYYYPSLFLFAKKLTGSHEEGEDIAVKTFQKLFNLREKFNTGDNIKAFLYISVRNNCLNYLKSRQRSHEDINLFAEKMEDDTLLYFEYQGRKELIKAIRAAIDNLPEECCKIFKLLYYEEMTPAEIAQMLRISVFTVYTQKRRAIESLRLMLADNSLAIAWLIYTVLHV